MGGVPAAEVDDGPAEPDGEKKCLRHYQKASFSAPRTVPSHRGDRAFVCPAPEPSGLHPQPGQPRSGSGSIVVETPLLPPPLLHRVVAVFCVLDVSLVDRGHAQVTCLSPGSPRGLPPTLLGSACTHEPLGLVLHLLLIPSG